jgi:hypothetical protein
MELSPQQERAPNQFRLCRYLAAAAFNRCLQRSMQILMRLLSKLISIEELSEYSKMRASRICAH